MAKRSTLPSTIIERDAAMAKAIARFVASLREVEFGLAPYSLDDCLQRLDPQDSAAARNVIASAPTHSLSNFVACALALAHQRKALGLLHCDQEHARDLLAIAGAAMLTLAPRSVFGATSRAADVDMTRLSSAIADLRTGRIAPVLAVERHPTGAQPPSERIFMFRRSAAIVAESRHRMGASISVACSETSRELADDARRLGIAGKQGKHLNNRTGPRGATPRPALTEAMVNNWRKALLKADHVVLGPGVDQVLWLTLNTHQPDDLPFLVQRHVRGCRLL